MGRYAPTDKSHMPEVVRLLAEWGATAEPVHLGDELIDLARIRVDYDLYVLKDKSELAMRVAAAHRELTLVFEDVEIVVDPDPRQVDQLVPEMHRLRGGAPLGEQPDHFRHVALVGGRVSSHQQSDPHSISLPPRPAASDALGYRVAAVPPGPLRQG